MPGAFAYALTFDALPSVNEYIREAGRSAFHAGKFEKKWRVVGHRAMETHFEREALAACRRADGTTGVRAKEPVLKGGVYVKWVVVKAGRRVRDSVFNLYTKPVEDGFTDAGLWPGDDDRYVKGRVVEVEEGEQAAVVCYIYTTEGL